METVSLLGSDRGAGHLYRSHYVGRGFGGEGFVRREVSVVSLIDFSHCKTESGSFSGSVAFAGVHTGCKDHGDGVVGCCS